MKARGFFIRYPILLICLSICLCACSRGIRPPTAEEILAYRQNFFSCLLTVEDETGTRQYTLCAGEEHCYQPQQGALIRYCFDQSGALTLEAGGVRFPLCTDCRRGLMLVEYLLFGIPAERFFVRTAQDALQLSSAEVCVLIDRETLLPTQMQYEKDGTKMTVSLTAFRFSEKGD